MEMTANLSLKPTTRAAQIQDTQDISNLLQSVFGETCGKALDEQRLQKYLTNYLSKPVPEEDMKTSNYFVNETEQALLDVLKLTWDSSTKKAEIGKLYISEEARYRH